MTGSLVEYSRKSESENFMLGNIFGDSRFYVSILSVIRHKVNLSFIVYRRLFLSLLRKILFTMPPYLLRQTDISILSISIELSTVFSSVHKRCTIPHITEQKCSSIEPQHQTFPPFKFYSTKISLFNMRFQYSS